MKQMATTVSMKSSASRRLWLAFVLGVLSAFGPFCLDMYLPALPMLANELQTSASYAQLSLTACMIGLAAGQLFAGPISDVRGRRMPLILGLLLYIVSSLLCMFTQSVWVFIFLRFLQGVAGAVGIVLSKAMVRDLYSGSELTKFFALLMLVNGAAPIIAPIAGGQLLEITSWRGIFFVLSLIGVFSLISVVWSLGETLPPERRLQGGMKQTFISMGHILCDRLFMGYALSQGLVTAAMFAYIAGSPFVLQNIYNFTPQMFSVYFAINGIGIIIATQVTGRLSGRYGETKLLIVGLSLAAVSGIALLVAVILNANIFAVLIPLFFLVSCVGIVGTTTFSLAMAKQEKTAGSAAALLGLLSFLFGGIVAPLVGMGGEHTALPMAVIIAVTEILALVLYFVMAHRQK
ncbi:multidrug effflux MFS transporter [Bacillus massiliigorillae]|uniref:multidrug effflux MFS transporter n=1 Tax=Bacillus massiliigorillae TaxID=1243664 RepID=UPI0003A88010|nr:multidrug effflux MFS transporter [Bacillus massiliigorillae]